MKRLAIAALFLCGCSGEPEKPRPTEGTVLSKTYCPAEAGSISIPMGGYGVSIDQSFSEPERYYLTMRADDGREFTEAVPPDHWAAIDIGDRWPRRREASK